MFIEYGTIDVIWLSSRTGFRYNFKFITQNVQLWIILSTF